MRASARRGCQARRLAGAVPALGDFPMIRIVYPDSWQRMNPGPLPRVRPLDGYETAILETVTLGITN